MSRSLQIWLETHLNGVDHKRRGCWEGRNCLLVLGSPEVLIASLQLETFRPLESGAGAAVHLELGALVMEERLGIETEDVRVRFIVNCTHEVVQLRGW